MDKFVCPICGKSYDTAIEMADCVVKDDKADKEKQKTALIDRKREAVVKAYNVLKEAVAAFNTIADNGEYYTSSLSHSDKKTVKSSCGCKTSCCKEEPSSKVNIKIKDKDINPAEFEHYMKTTDFNKVKDEIKKSASNKFNDSEIETAWNFLLGLFD